MKLTYICRWIFLSIVLSTLAIPESLGQLTLATADSTTTMRIRIGLQMQYEYANPSTSPSTGKVSVERARLILTGKAFFPGLTYFYQLAAEPSQRDITPEDPNKTLLDGWLQYAPSRHFLLRVGQYNMPALRQGYTGIMFQQFTNRSILSNTFTYNRDVGIMLQGNFDIRGIIIKPHYLFVTGDGRSFLNLETNTGNQHIFKVEVLTGGEYATGEGFTEADLDREGHPKGSFGIGYEINRDPLRARGNTGPFISGPDGLSVGANVRSLLIDGQVKYRGFSFLIEYIRRESDDARFLSGEAFNLQIGYLFISNLEIAVRYARINQDGMEDPVDERRISFNRYFKNHDLKIQAEIGKVNGILNNDATRFRLMATLFI